MKYIEGLIEYSTSYARVVKLGQRRKVEGLVLSGSWVQIPALASFFHYYNQKNSETEGRGNHEVPNEVREWPCATFFPLTVF